MPLRDHFHPPLSEQAAWEEVHGKWPAVIVQQLEKILPERFVAAPRVHLVSQREADIAALDRDRAPVKAAAQSDANGGSIATVVWAPAEPSLAVETELA